MKKVTLQITIHSIASDMRTGSELLDCYMRPVQSVRGGVLLCEGGWNNPKNAVQFGSAISALHEQFGMTLYVFSTSLSN